MSELVEVLGVRITDVTIDEAVGRLEALLRDPEKRSRSVFFVNAHTLNLAAEDPAYRRVLDEADLVFGDGTGVRWAARLRGVRLVDNVNGTDLVPRFLETGGDAPVRTYLLGATAETIERTARAVRERFPRVELVGWRDGYLGPGEAPAVVERINEARPDLLLVGMGNPKQERWIHEHQAALRVPLCIAVGGLFDHWAGNLRRAAPLVRRLGFEWLQLLIQQPHKAGRYVLGNPRFLARSARWALSGRLGGRAA